MRLVEILYPSFAPIPTVPGRRVELLGPDGSLEDVRARKRESERLRRQRKGEEINNARRQRRAEARSA